MTGPCAKAVVRCRIVALDGSEFLGENYCRNPQVACPRQEGEGYEKCQTICGQVGHAELVALRLAGLSAIGATAYLSGHTYACRNCQEAMFAAGIRFFGIE